MGIGGSIFLVAIGAIIAFGVRYDVSWLDLKVVGWVFMIAGITGIVLTLVLQQRNKRRITEERQVYDERQGRPQ